MSDVTSRRCPRCTGIQRSRVARYPSWECQKCATISFYDVDSVEAFVQDAINASRRTYGPDMRDELVAEGFRIMHDLAGRFEPHREGYETEGRFGGFAAKYLRLKLEDAYHRLCPEHQLRTQPDGTRAWEYGEKAVSLEALTGDEEERSMLLAYEDQKDGSIDYVERGLIDRALREVEQVVKVARCLHRGMEVADICEETRLEPERVRRFERLIWRAAPPNGRQFTSIREVRERLELQARQDAATAMRVAELLSGDWSYGDVALELGIEMGEFHDHMEAIKLVTEGNRVR